MAYTFPKPEHPASVIEREAPMSQFDAFRLGYRDAARVKRWTGKNPVIAASGAALLRPRLLNGVATLDAYLNGWDDGAAGDTYRLEAIADIEATGIRF